MQIKGSQFSSIEQITGQYLHNTGKNNSSKDVQTAADNFQTVLASKVEEAGGLKFTKHANERLDSRDITLSDEQMQRLENGARRAGEKGIRESLVLVDSLAFIVRAAMKTISILILMEQ